MEKNTPMPVEVIDGQNLSSRPVAHETKPLDVTIGSHTSKVSSMLINFQKILSSLDCLGLFYIICKWISI